MYVQGTEVSRVLASQERNKNHDEKCVNQRLSSMKGQLLLRFARCFSSPLSPALRKQYQPQIHSYLAPLSDKPCNLSRILRDIVSTFRSFILRFMLLEMVQSVAFRPVA